jgi:hypothetical protein
MITSISSGQKFHLRMSVLDSLLIDAQSYRQFSLGTLNKLLRIRTSLEISSIDNLNNKRLDQHRHAAFLPTHLVKQLV